MPIPTHRCTACGVSTGGWDTLIDVSREDCEYEGGISSAPGNDPNETGPCGNAYGGVSCDTYYTYPQLHGSIPIRMITPWEPFSGQDNVYGDAYYDECDINRIGTLGLASRPGERLDTVYYRYTDEIALNYRDPETIQQQCQQFGQLRNIETCWSFINLYPPVELPDATITESLPAAVDNSGSVWDYIPPVLVGIGLVGVGTAIYTWWNRPPNEPPPPPPPRPTIDGPIFGESAQAAAETAMEVAYAVGAVAAGAITAAAIISVAPAAGAGLAVATVLIVVYNSDGSTASSFTVDVTIPADGA